MDTALRSYLEGAAEFETAVTLLDEAALDLVRAPGMWTARQIAHHLADGDTIWTAAVKRALGDSRPVFDLRWYWERPQDEWVERWAYSARAVAPSLALLRANREHVAQLVRAVPGAWQCAVRLRTPDGALEDLTAGAIISMQARHAWQHLDEIRAIAEAYAHAAPRGG